MPHATPTISADGRLVASAGGDGTIGIWDSRRLQASGEVRHAGPVAVVGLSFCDAPRKSLPLCRLRRPDRPVDLASRGSTRSQQAGSGHVLAASFAGDGQWMASLRWSSGAREASIGLWGVVSGAPIETRTVSSIRSSTHSSCSPLGKFN
jgi:WD40 repeat protein